MSLLDSPQTDTLPKLLERNAQESATAAGMREKTRGVWQTFTWADYRDRVRDLALGLASLGFQRGDKLSVVGDNRPQLYIGQIAAQVLGGMSVPVYQDSIAAELVYVLNHAETSVIIAEDQEQVDKALSLKDKLPNLRLIVFDDPRGLWSYDDPILRPFESVLDAGREFARANPDFYATELAKGSADDIAMIAYTSGTTGNPKGVMLSHRNMIAGAESFIEVNDVRAGDNWLSYLPMAWLGDAAFSLGMALVGKLTANCPESPETVQRDLRELGPHAMLAPPRIWESMLTQMQVKGDDASPVKRRVFESFRSLAERCELKRTDGKPLSLAERLGLAVGEVFVYGPVRDQLGLRNARWCYTGGAPLGPDTYRFFRSFGINLKQIYGATEASALVTCQSNAEANPNTVGRPMPRVEVKIDDRGEVILRGPTVFRGYFKQEDSTRATMTSEGWLMTGDAGFFDKQGHLVIIDRARDVGKLADGSAFAPQFIENKLKFSPYIREAVAFGNDKPMVVAMIAIDMQTVGSWAERKGIAYSSFMDLSRKPEVATLIADEIAKANATLPDVQQVKRFLILNKELEADDAEMTRTRKVRRRFVAEKYAAVIDAFYDGSRQVKVTMEITFEDGRKSSLTSDIDIHDLGSAEPSRRAA
ncbi:MAG: AMP-binding protein [Proteobacteria bacterium]|nr:AMP-binding protein [Pseudomonadota bacterium]